MVKFIKEQYPKGTRIRLNSMEDPYAPIAPGTEGEVDFVDDLGSLHMPAFTAAMPSPIGIITSGSSTPLRPR